MDELVSKAVVRRIINSPRNKEQMLRMLDSIPPTQSKMGKWIEYEQEFMLGDPFTMVQKTVRECSVCTVKIAGMVGIMNFCPNCGAKMEGEESGKDDMGR